MRRLNDRMDDENILNSDELLDDPDDILLEEQDDDDPDDDQPIQQRHPRMSIDEEIIAEEQFLAAEAEKQKQKTRSADTGSTADAIRLKDVHLAPEDKELKRLKRDLRLEALRRLEESARYPWEYKKVTDTWNLLDANRQRLERDHELLRGNVPIDYDTDPSTVTVFPRYLNDPIRRQVQRGRFEDALADCVHTMQDFTAKEYVREAVMSLIRNHKESLYLLYIKQIPPKELAVLRGSSFQAVYRTKETMLHRLREAAYEALSSMQGQGMPLTKEERLFVAKYHSTEQQDDRKEADE